MSSDERTKEIAVHFADGTWKSYEVHIGYDVGRLLTASSHLVAVKEWGHGEGQHARRLRAWVNPSQIVRVEEEWDDRD